MHSGFEYCGVVGIVGVVDMIGVVVGVVLVGVCWRVVDDVVFVR